MRIITALLTRRRLTCRAVTNDNASSFALMPKANDRLRLRCRFFEQRWLGLTCLYDVSCCFDFESRTTPTLAGNSCCYVNDAHRYTARIRRPLSAQTEGPIVAGIVLSSTSMVSSCAPIACERCAFPAIGACGITWLWLTETPCTAPGRQLCAPRAIEEKAH